MSEKLTCYGCGDAIDIKALCMKCVEAEESDRLDAESDALLFYSLLSDLWAKHYQDGDHYGIYPIPADLAKRIIEALPEDWEP